MHELTATELRRRILARDVSCVESTRHFLARIRRFDPEIKAFLCVTEETALKQAAAVDAAIAAGSNPGPLCGIPIAIKDVLNWEGTITTCGSRYLENYVSPYTATAVERVIAAGAVVLGKTNTDEFAMGSSTENSGFFTTRNPWDLSRVPGGSSGGSAAAVGARLVLAALGSDTGGSIRQPAALCGVTGLKPTYGRISRYGLVAYASSLDQIGPFTVSVEDAALFLTAMAGGDRSDATCLNEPAPDFAGQLPQGDAARDLKGLKVGLPKEYFGTGLYAGTRACFDRAVEVVRGLGADVHEVSLPMSKYAIATYYIVAPAEASSNLARYDGMHYGFRTPAPAGLIETYSRSRGESLGAEVQRRIMLGTYVLCSGYRDAYYLKALKVRSLIRQDFERVFGEVDVLLNPVTPEPAFKIGERADDPLAMYLSDIYTVTANMAGVPAMSIPVGNTDYQGVSLPVGMMISAKPFDEAALLRAGAAYQAATADHRLTPAAWR
ncbi:MAG: Asp-tRNA(Asn)/Glu-tRNA(Gln) amidotransferase subunit GatA [Planctomycetota bacterium]